MAKKVGERVKELWVIAKKDMAESSQDFKRDFIDMMEFAKTKGSLKIKPSSSLKKAGSTVDLAVNQDVGAELLSHFKDEWAAIHNETDQASKAAVKMDSDLQAIHHSIAQSHTVISRCNDEFEKLTDTVQAINETQKRVEKLGDLLQEVEQSIIECAQYKAQLESERKKQSLRIQLERHCAEGEAKVDHLNKVRAEEKRLLVEWNASQESQELVERQQAFQEIFDQQMADYKQSGHLDHPISSSDERERSDSNLEEMVIEDKDGTTSLNEFLSDVIIEEGNGGAEKAAATD